MLTTAILPILFLLSSTANASPYHSDKYVTSAAFQAQITPQRLLKHAYSLSNITQSKGGDRFVGSVAQKASLAYIKNLLDSTGYYKTEYQNVPFTLRTHNLTLTVDGKALPGLGVDRCIEKEAAGPLLLIPGAGCTAVRPPSCYPKLCHSANYISGGIRTSRREGRPRFSWPVCYRPTGCIGRRGQGDRFTFRRGRSKRCCTSA